MCSVHMIKIKPLFITQLRNKQALTNFIAARLDFQGTLKPSTVSQITFM